MEVVITKDRLMAARACRKSYLNSPEWDAEREALVYANWDATAKRLLSTKDGIVYLDFLVANGLVPMTREQFKAARKGEG